MDTAQGLLCSFFSFGLTSQGYCRLTNQSMKGKSFMLMSTFLLLLAIHPRCISQDLDENSFQIIPYSFDSDYTVVAIVDEETMSQPHLLFTEEQLRSYNTTTYLFLNTLSLEDIYNQLNISIRSNSDNLNKKGLHLIIKGSANVLDTYTELDTDYFNTCRYISTDQRMANAKEAYVTSHEIEWSGEKYLQSIQGKYFWELEMADKKKPTRVLKNHEEGKFTIGYKPVVNFSLKDNALGEYFTNGLNVDYAIIKKLQIYGGVSFSLKRPDPQSEVRSQILNQLNVSEIQSGDFQTEEVSLSIPIEGHVHVEALIGIKYIMGLTKSVSPYFSSEISRIISSKISGRVDTTIILDLSNGFDRSLSQDLDRDNLESLGIQAKQANHTNIGIGTGLQCKLGGHLRFDLGVSYSTSIKDQSSESNFNNNAIRLNLGINYRFKDRKEYDLVHFY